jgi:hypothetical protein
MFAQNKISIKNDFIIYKSFILKVQWCDEVPKAHQTCYAKILKILKSVVF